MTRCAHGLGLAEMDLGEARAPRLGVSARPARMAPASVAKAMDRPGAYADGGERLHRELREGESDQSEEAARGIGKVPAPACEDEKV